MHIEPHAWLITLPLTIALIQIYFLPPDHSVKRLWRAIGQFEATAWDRLGWAAQPFDLSAPRSRRIIFAAVVAALSISTVVSLAAFAGFASGS